jgi:hypothetical protein
MPGMGIVYRELFLRSGGMPAAVGEMPISNEKPMSGCWPFRSNIAPQTFTLR